MKHVGRQLKKGGTMMRGVMNTLYNKIKSQIKSKLGVCKVRKGGEEFIFNCPKCGRMRLEVNFRKSVFNCFRCSYGGSLYDLAKYINVDCFDYIMDTDDWYLPYGFEKDVNQKLEMPNFILWEMLNYNEVVDIKDFLINRNINPDLEPARFGMSSAKHLRGRLILPICEQGETVCWLARSMDGKLPKELSPKADVSNKSHYLYNLDSIRLGDQVVVVEGVFDCIRIHQGGYKSVAVMGSNPSDIQIGKLLAKRPKSIVIMYDGDEAGKQGWIKTHQKIQSRTGQEIRVIRLPEGCDPDQLKDDKLKEIMLIAGVSASR